ncbi:MAG: N-acetyltransferase [Clostridia bacterium]|nr:N-acetyltransferase [Clostridia bacterium]
MLNFKIDYAALKDVKQINNIVNYYIETSGANWAWEPRRLKDAKRWFLSHDFSLHPILVARAEGGKVLGYASLSPFRPKEGYWPVAEISIYVDKDYHNMKIGKMLMEKLIEDAYSSKLEVITAWIDSENKKSIDFHNKWGFETIGELKNVGDKWNTRRSVTIMQLSVIKK